MSEEEPTLFDLPAREAQAAGLPVVYVRRCTRLGDHVPHSWSGRLPTSGPDEVAKRAEFWCTGNCATEGAVTSCPHCGGEL